MKEAMRLQHVLLTCLLHWCGPSAPLARPCLEPLEQSDLRPEISAGAVWLQVLIQAPFYPGYCSAHLMS